MAQVFKNDHLKEGALNAFYQLSHSSFSIPAIQAKAGSGKLYQTHPFRVFSIQGKEFGNVLCVPCWISFAFLIYRSLSYCPSVALLEVWGPGWPFAVSSFRTSLSRTQDLVPAWHLKTKSQPWPPVIPVTPASTGSSSRPQIIHRGSSHKPLRKQHFWEPNHQLLCKP